MATFVLVHGAWHGAWCWELLTPILEAEGHQVIAPDLPGMGDDPTPLEHVSIESCARFVAEIVDVPSATELSQNLKSPSPSLHAGQASQRGT